MAKLLPLTGIVAAVLSAIVVVANLSILQVLLPLLAILAGVFAILERGRPNMVLGVVLIVAGLALALLAIPEGITKGGTDSGSQVAGNSQWAGWFALLGGAVAVLAVVAVRRNSFTPPWLGTAAIAAAVVALALAAWKVSNLSAGFADLGNAWPLYVAAVLFLGAGYVNLVALRSPDTVVTTTTTTHTTHVAHTAAAEPAHGATQATHTTSHAAKPKAAKKKAASKRKA